MSGSRDSYRDRTFDFLDRLRACADADEIAETIINEMRDFGFECLTCFTLPAPSQALDAGLMLNTRPREYIERYAERNYV